MAYGLKRRRNRHRRCSNRQTHGDEPAPQVIVLIHGTAAASDSDEGDRWWQRGSSFACGLNNLTFPRAKCLEQQRLFHWSGNNSERDRRFFGKRLYEDFIRPFEQQSRPYHLIAHSHGGGVIVAALIEAVRRSHRLEYLRSWFTIATPFLSYKTRARHWTCLLPIVAVLISLIWLIPLATEYLSHRDELLQSGSLTAIILPPVLIGLPIVMAILAVVAWAVSAVRQALLGQYAKLRQRAVFEYGDRWLGIASSADEAINGLRSTLTLFSNIAWRLPPLRNLKLFPRIILAPLQPLAWFYNMFIASAADEFIWSLTTRRLQGADLQGQVLTKVSPDLQPGSFNIVPLAPDLEAEIIARANADSVGTLASVRSVLGLASQASDSGYALLAGVKKSITWQELVHTSYMRYPAVEELVARHVLEGAKRGRARSVVLSAAMAAAADPPVAPSLPKLSTVINWAFVVAIGLTVLLGVLVTRALVGPYTDQFQVDAIWNELNDPEVRNPHGASVGLSSILAARALIVRDGKTENFASSIRSPHTKHLAMEWVAEADALTNNLPAAQELIRNIDDVSASEDAVAAVYQLLASTGNCSAAGSFLPSALEVARRSVDRRLVFYVAEGLKTCNRRQDALELMRKGVTAAKSRSWDADFVVSSLALLNEEGETTDAINELFKTPAERSSEFITAATVFMGLRNTDAAKRLLSKVGPDNVAPKDGFAALKLYAQLDDIAAIDQGISRSAVSCNGLAQLGEIFMRGKATGHVHYIEQVMIAEATAFPIKSVVAECLLDVSLLQNSSGEIASANQTFATATELIGQIPNNDGVRAKLSGLAAEVALRSSADVGRSSEWLRNAESDADKLPPLPAFQLLIRLADIALSAGRRDDLMTILKKAEQAIARDTEYQSRSPKYRQLAERYAAAGWYRQARLIAERAVISDERLQAFVVIVWKIRGRDTPLLGALLGVTKDDDGDISLTDLNPNEQKRAADEDEKQLLRIGVGPVCPSACSVERRR